MSIEFSVAICTHNRSHDVGRCIDALSRQKGHKVSEIIIIDSDSSSEHGKNLKSIAHSYGSRYAKARESGLSQARNLALELSSHEWVSFLDDDSVPFTNWAENLSKVVQTASEETAVIGGLIMPRSQEGNLPKNLTQRWQLLLSCVTAPGSGEVQLGYNVCGANMVVRRSAINEVGGFNPMLGRDQSSLLSCEEALIIELLHDIGRLCVYDSSFGVEHIIQPDRLRLSWAANRSFWEGRSRARMRRLLGRRPTIATNTFKLCLSLPILFILHRFRKSPDWTIRLNMALGILCEQAYPRSIWKRLSPLS